MKPPSRHRVKPSRYLNRRTDKRRGSTKLIFYGWSRLEQQSLATCLRRQSKVIGSTGEIDYSALKQALPKRSIAEIRAKVEALKSRVIRQVMHQVVRQRKEERRAQKPIELWEGMALAAAGALEESITTAFSQMLTISSAEPRTLMNSDPPRVAALPPPRGVTKTYSKRLQSAFPFLASPSAAPTRVIRKDAASPSAGPAQEATEAGSPVVGGASAAALTPQAPPPSPGAPAVSALPAPPVPRGAQAASSTAGPPGTPVPVASQCRAANASSQPAGPPAATHPNSSAALERGLCDRVGAAGPSARAQDPGAWSTMCLVDFERVYGFLSAAHKPDEEATELTPMESALVLELLMCLPEELPLLDCHALQDHLHQAYARLSAPADPRSPSLSVGEERSAVPGPEARSDPGRDSPRPPQPPTDGHAKGAAGGPGPDFEDGERMDSTNQGQAAAATAGSSGNLAAEAGDSSAVAPGGVGLPRNAAGEGGGGATTSQSSGDGSKGESDWEKAGLCPLNPFTVPLRLLARRQAR